RAMSRWCSFYWSASDPALHAFPTRRSSDLYQVVVEQVLLHGDGVVEAVIARQDGRKVDQRLRAVPGAARGAGEQLPEHERRLRRSEEHTSELQSRENLVCRLLLEKKKKKMK